MILKNWVMTTLNKKKFNSLLGLFRLVALAEGVSYLFLLFIAMPLKYVIRIADPVKYAGWLHGLLFLLYGLLLIKVWMHYRWSFKKVVGAMIAALVPFGTFVLDRRLRRET